MGIKYCPNFPAHISAIKFDVCVVHGQKICIECADTDAAAVHYHRYLGVHDLCINKDVCVFDMECIIHMLAGTVHEPMTARMLFNIRVKSYMQNKVGRRTIIFDDNRSREFPPRIPIAAKRSESRPHVVLPLYPVDPETGHISPDTIIQPAHVCTHNKMLRNFLAAQLVATFGVVTVGSTIQGGTAEEQRYLQTIYEDCYEADIMIIRLITAPKNSPFSGSTAVFSVDGDTIVLAALELDNSVHWIRPPPRKSKRRKEKPYYNSNIIDLNQWKRRIAQSGTHPLTWFLTLMMYHHADYNCPIPRLLHKSVAYRRHAKPYVYFHTPDVIVLDRAELSREVWILRKHGDALLTMLYRALFNLLYYAGFTVSWQEFGWLADGNYVTPHSWFDQYMLKSTLDPCPFIYFYRNGEWEEKSVI